MDIFKTIERINKLHTLIKEEKTGTPKYLAEQIGISRASLYRLIEEMKSYDVPIEYSRIKESFYYTKQFELLLNCSLLVIEDENELKKIEGGHHFFSSISILRRKDSTFVSVN